MRFSYSSEVEVLPLCSQEQPYMKKDAVPWKRKTQHNFLSDEKNCGYMDKNQVLLCTVQQTTSKESGMVTVVFFSAERKVLQGYSC